MKKTMILWKLISAGAVQKHLKSLTGFWPVWIKVRSFGSKQDSAALIHGFLSVEYSGVVRSCKELYSTLSLQSKREKHNRTSVSSDAEAKPFGRRPQLSTGTQHSHSVLVLHIEGRIKTKTRLRPLLITIDGLLKHPRGYTTKLLKMILKYSLNISTQTFIHPDVETVVPNKPWPLCSFTLLGFVSCIDF